MQLADATVGERVAQRNTPFGGDVAEDERLDAGLARRSDEWGAIGGRPGGWLVDPEMLAAADGMASASGADAVQARERQFAALVAAIRRSLDSGAPEPVEALEGAS